MQPANDVQFSDTQGEGFACLLDDLIHAELKAISISFLSAKSAKLTTENAVIGVVDVPIDDVARTVSHLSCASKIAQCRDGIEVWGLPHPQGVGLGESFTACQLVVKVA